jgi:hypothetical protein
MKKVILFILISELSVSFSTAQKLLDIYKNGPVKLTSEKTYGAKNNWDSVFNLYYETLTNYVGREENKKIIVSPDGSVFMSHKNRWEIWKFGPDGNFVKRFGSKGSKPGQFIYMPTVHPVAENKYVFTSDVGGRLNFFDLEGNFVKKIGLKYIGQDFQPVGGAEILLNGFVIWDKKTRYIVVRLNLNTEKEVIVYDYFSEREEQLKVENIDSLINAQKKNLNFHIPGDYVKINYSNMAFLPDGKFIKCDRNSGELIVVDKYGKEMQKIKLDVERVRITESDVNENYERMKQVFTETIERIKRLKLITSPNTQSDPDKSTGNLDRYITINQKFLNNVDLYKDIKNYYPYFPYFSNIISDDEGNLLVFEFTNSDQKESNIFNVIAYDNTGKKLARTSFICEDYDLSFSESTFVISKGYVYAVAKLKNYKGMPLRLVKFKISN